MSAHWKAALGFVAAQAVKAAARLSSTPERCLSDSERALAQPVFERSLNLNPIRVRAPVAGPVGVSRRAFVIEDVIFVPAAYLPLAPAVLIHELVHVWQHQNGGPGYIADSLHAQWVGEGYALERAAAEARPWHALNCEQQATLIEEAWGQGVFEGKPMRLGTRDVTDWAQRAVEELRAARGSRF